jgi:thiol:disulfide interchange protein DsbA
MLLRALLSLAFAGVCALASAQSEGRQYLRLAHPPRVTSAGEIEVIEFFAYSCPHCYRLDPTLRKWINANARRVKFRRVHVETKAFELHQRFFSAMQVMHVNEDSYFKVFQAFHEKGNLLRSERGLQMMWKELGLPPEELRPTLDSKEVDQEVEKAKQAQANFGVTKWPALVVGGTFLTNPELASAGTDGSDEQRAIELTMQALGKMLGSAEKEKR